MRTKTKHECGICFAEQRMVRIRPCGHEYCRECLRRAFVINPRCPTCRADVRGVSELLIDERVQKVRVSTAEHGIVVSAKRGVLICKAESDGAAWTQGVLRTPAPLLAINGVPCATNAKLASALLESASEEAPIELCLEYLPPPPTTLFCCLPKPAPRDDARP
jgi:hypothetical protein